ncbi:hypothetical protein ASD11_15585 [Aeromicrobium sp. Root495]|nr:hypothetical protein ASD11_15585 [Aeromicrobium sp. Root495]
MVVLVAFLAAGCSSEKDDPKPSDPLPMLEESVTDGGSESLGTVFERKGTGPTTLTIDLPADVTFVRMGGTCSPAQVSDDPAELPFAIEWGGSEFATDCDPKSPGATATTSAARIGSDPTFKVKIAEGVAWRVAGISVSDPDD